MENQVVKMKNTNIDFVEDMVNEIGVFKAAQIIAKSSLLPIQFRDPANVIIAMDLAKRTGISLFAITNSVNIIQGKPCWNSTSIMSMLKNEYNRKGLKVSHKFVGDRDTDDWGCYILVTNDDGDILEQGSTVTISMAKREGWSSKSGSKWNTMPEQMLIYRAYTFFARVAIPELLMGFNHTSEEIEDIHSSNMNRMQVINPFENEGDLEND